MAPSLTDTTPRNHPTWHGWDNLHEEINRASATCWETDPRRPTIEAMRRLTRAFHRAAEQLPTAPPACLICGHPSPTETCTQCVRESWEETNPTLDCRDPTRIVWAIAQRHLKTTHAPHPISDQWWAEAELFQGATK